MKTLLNLMASKGYQLEKNVQGNYQQVVGTEEVERLSGKKVVKRYIQLAKDMRTSKYYFINQMKDERFEGTLKEMKEYLNINY